MRSYVLYDARAILGETEDASVLSACADDEEARDDAEMFGYDLACFSYEVADGIGSDERHEWNYVDGKFIRVR